MKKAKTKRMKPGLYENVKILGVRVNEDKTLQMRFDFSKAKKIANNPIVKDTIPEAGQLKYFVSCEKLAIYTSIGADNIHHASNKATKLFGPHWSQVTREFTLIKGYEYVIVGVFRGLLRTLTF